jgi:alpha-1,2-mannosyltransferase
VRLGVRAAAPSRAEELSGESLLERTCRLPIWVFVIVALLAWGFAASYLIVFGSHWLLDLRTYRAGVRAVVDGRHLYSIELTRIKLLYTYPPFGIFATFPLGFGPLRLVEVLFWIVDAGAATSCVYFAIGLATDLRGKKILALSAAVAGICTMLLEPVRSNVDFGQINILLYLLVLVDLTRVRGRGRGSLIGIAAAIKLTPLIFLFYFVVKRDWRGVRTTIAAFVGASLLAFAVLPSDSIQFWFHKGFDANRTGHLGYVSNQSWMGLLHRFPFHYADFGGGLWVLLALGTLAIGVVLAHRLIQHGQRLDAFIALALTGDVIGPVSWTHHWSWVLVLPIAIFARHSKRQRGTYLLSALLAMTIVAPYWWKAHGDWRFLTSNSLVLTGAIVLVVWTLLVLRSPSQGTPEPVPAGVEESTAIPSDSSVRS